MAIGVLSSHHFPKWGSLLALGVVFLSFPVSADDQIKKKDGTIINGQILSSSNGQVFVSSKSSTGGVVKLPYYLSDIDTITMVPPDAVTKIKGAKPEVVIATLEPQIKQFAGLPVDWVIEAMANLAQAYSASNQIDKALATYAQIDALYPGSKYHSQAVAGKALVSLQQGKIDDALAQIQPIIEEANKNLAPSQAEGGLYATAYLVYGQALEAKKQPAKALEAYLTVKTMFYQNPTLADQSDQLAKKLRDQNPGLGVE